MYYLIDELRIPPKYQEVFIKKLPYFRKLYIGVNGIVSVAYTRTTLKVIRDRTIKNPRNSYLLIITFKSQKSFQEYHDNSTLARDIHAKISSYFEGKQLSIQTSLHGTKPKKQPLFLQGHESG